MKYRNYFNHELGSSDIYSKRGILDMTLDDVFKYELPLAYQYNTIGIPDDEELNQSMYASQYTDDNGMLRWRAGEPVVESVEKLPEPNYMEESQPVIPNENDIDYEDNDSQNDTQSEFPLENSNEEEKVPLIKAGIEKDENPYEEIQNDSNLSKEEKVAEIRKITGARNKEINKEHQKKMAKIIGGGALEIGSNFIPGTIGAKAVGGLAKALGPVGKKLLAPKIGKKLTDEVVKSTAGGVVSAPVAAVGKSMLEDKKISESFDPKGSVVDGITLGMPNPITRKIIRGNQLKK